MNEERTGKYLRQVEHIRGHLWHRYSITVNQVIVTILKFSKWPKGTLSSVASLLAATLYQGNPDRNKKLWGGDTYSLSTSTWVSWGGGGGLAYLMKGDTYSLSTPTWWRWFQKRLVRTNVFYLHFCFRMYFLYSIVAFVLNIHLIFATGC